MTSHEFNPSIESPQPRRIADFLDVLLEINDNTHGRRLMTLRQALEECAPVRTVLDNAEKSGQLEQVINVWMYKEK